MNNFTFITGSTGGLGKQFSLTSAKQQRNLFLTGRSAEKLENLKTELLGISPLVEILTFPCDLTNSSERNDMFSFIVEKGLVFDRLINVSGVDVQKEFLKYTQDKLMFQARVNFESVLSVTHFVLTHRAEKLDVLTVGSMCGTTPMPYFAEYSATKAALENFFSALRYEVKNARISVLAPGSIPTREDIKEDIKKQGLSGKLSAKPPEYVVKVALRGLEKNKRLIIPGVFNKFVFFIEKITPKSLQLKFIAKKFGKKEKDAF